MPFPKGNQYAKTNGGGRKTIKEEVAAVINMGMANNIANKKLRKLNEQDDVDLGSMKVVVMPIVVKGITETKDINVITPQPLLYAILPNNDSYTEDNKTEKKT